MRGIAGFAVFLWLLIGVFATWQRGFFSTNDTRTVGFRSQARNTGRYWY